MHWQEVVLDRGVVAVQAKPSGRQEIPRLWLGMTEEKIRWRAVDDGKTTKA